MSVKEPPMFIRVGARIVHIVKCWPRFIDDLYAARKPFELRFMDRAYIVGDTLAQREWHPIKEIWGQRIYVARIGYILRSEEAASSGLRPGFGILGLERIGRDEIEDVREAVMAAFQ